MWGRRLVPGRTRTAVAGVSLLVALVALPSPAQAAFPGKNGKLLFDCTEGVCAINPDGTGRTVIAANAGTGRWSPDGRKIAFYGEDGVRTINADGTGETLLPTHGGIGLTWSPDGSRIAFGGYEGIHVMNSDGSGVTKITDHPDGDLNPQWAPDGSKIVFERYFGSDSAIYTVTPDGTAVSRVDRTPNNPDFSASWSPDGSKILFTMDTYFPEYDFADYAMWIMDSDGDNLYLVETEPAGYEHTGLHVWSPDGARIAVGQNTGNPNGRSIALINPDGTAKQMIPNTDTQAVTDWQPIPINSYLRPKAATPIEATLVPAYVSCTSPNRIHGPPLAYGSCNPPAQASDELTLGTPDANAKPVRGEGLVRYQALGGNPANQIEEGDVRITVELHDVYEQGTPLTGYRGELRARTTLRITDKLNTPHPGGPGAATVSDTTLGLTVPCAPNPNQGADCAIVTSANALAPGTVIEGRRAVWELGQVQVDDGGADRDADTAADNTLFMVQGVFIP
jgi:dipeptidyl aminopeptidase/acylaminoacyl peptidase